MRSGDPLLRVALEAPDDISRSGLDRIAHLAGLEVALEGEDAAIALRYAGSGLRTTKVDIEVGGDGITVRVAEPPPLTTWVRLHGLLEVLSSARSRDELSH